MSSFTAYYGAKEDDIREAAFNLYLKSLLAGKYKGTDELEHVSHITDLWLDYFSVEIRREMGSDDENDF